MEEEENQKEQLQDLIKENLLLRTELNFYKGKDAGKGKIRNWAKRMTTNYLVGKGLKKSVKQLYEEIPDQKVTKDSLAEFTSHLIMRITRIGTFTILITILPLLVLSVQTYILNNQNTLLRYQNNRLDQQVNLEEGNRRSSLVFLMSNLMDKIGEETSQPNNNGRLSESLISRIISLSQAFRPYRYLENDQLIKQPLSPERGQLLLSLINSNLKIEVYQKIFLKANFSYSDLQGANLVDAYLREINLQYANLKGVNFQGADLDYANISFANMQKADFKNATMNNSRLAQADLSEANLEDVEMRNGNMMKANLSNAFFGGDFSNTTLRGIKVDNLTFKFVDLDGVKIQDINVLHELEKYNVSGKMYIEEYFDVNEKVTKDSLGVIVDHYYQFERKKASTLDVLGDCQKKVLEMIKSTERIKKLEEEAIKRKDPLVFIVKAHPFGEESLGIPKDTVYRYELTTEHQPKGLPLFKLSFDPDENFVTEMSLTDTVRHKILRSKRRGFSKKCWE
ncbi:MAG: pentapeptide repeat-containing protein [Saprospiraceae bacterium]